MEPNLRAERFAILGARVECHACHAETPVSALLVPAYAEFDGQEWIRSDDSGLLIYVEAVDASTQKAWCQRAPWVRPVASKTAGLTYLANTCACEALQGDFYLMKPGAPFFPLDDAGLAAINVDWVDAPIEAVAGTSQSSWLDRLIQRSPYHGWTAPPPLKPSRSRSRSRT